MRKEVIMSESQQKQQIRRVRFLKVSDIGPIGKIMCLKCLKKMRKKHYANFKNPWMCEEKKIQLPEMKSIIIEIENKIFSNWCVCMYVCVYKFIYFLAYIFTGYFYKKH